MINKNNIKYKKNDAKIIKNNENDNDNKDYKKIYFIRNDNGVNKHKNNINTNIGNFYVIETSILCHTNIMCFIGQSLKLKELRYSIFHYR
jgi:hypothetical protein